MDHLRDFLTFAGQSPTVYHAVAGLADRLRAEGFHELRETDPWLIDAGEKYFVLRNDAALIAFATPDTGFGAFRIVAAHGDSPAFKLKQHFEDHTREGYLRLNVEKYGGMIMSTWLDRPLSVAGRLILRRGDDLTVRLVNLDRDAALIPNLPIHFNREINSGYAYQPQVDLLPLFGFDGQPQEGSRLLEEIADRAGVSCRDILSHDLFLYNRQPASVWGAGDAFFSCQRIDDLECAFAAVEALPRTVPRDTVSVCAIFDNEEVGSASRQGADSNFLYDTLTRLGTGLGASDGEIRAAMAGSRMVSADNAHAVHPNHPDKYDSQNRVFMNQGVVIKHNAAQKYTTDGLSSARFELLCQRAGVPVQHFANRSDIAGGSTLGNIANTHISMETVDIGLAQLAMHSAYETAGTRDLDYLIQALSAFWAEG